MAERGHLRPPPDADFQPHRLVAALQVDLGQQDLRVVPGANQPEHVRVRHRLRPAEDAHPAQQVAAEQFPDDLIHDRRHDPHPGDVHQPEAAARIDPQALPAPALRQRHLDALPTVEGERKRCRVLVPETIGAAGKEHLQLRPRRRLGGVWSPWSPPMQGQRLRFIRASPVLRVAVAAVDLPGPLPEGVGRHDVVVPDVLGLGRAGAEEGAQQRRLHRLASPRLPYPQAPAVVKLEALALGPDFFPALPSAVVVVAGGDVVKEGHSPGAELAPPRFEVVPDSLVGVQTVEVDQVEAAVGKTRQGVVEAGTHQVGKAPVELLVVAGNVLVDGVAGHPGPRVALPGVHAVTGGPGAVLLHGLAERKVRFSAVRPQFHEHPRAQIRHQIVAESDVRRPRNQTEPARANAGERGRAIHGQTDHCSAARPSSAATGVRRRGWGRRPPSARKSGAWKDG